MFVFFGERLLGRVDAHDGTWVDTQFWHFNLLPLLPSRSWLALDDGARREPLPLHGRSVVLAYLRTWPFALALIERALGGTWTTSLSLALVGVVALLVRQPLGEERRKRPYYRALLGRPGDPAMLARVDPELERQLRARIEARAAALAPLAYREAGSARTWRELALDPTVDDPELLELALVLLRIEEFGLRGGRWWSTKRAGEKVLARLVRRASRG